MSDNTFPTVGDVFEGTVVSVVAFGAFVEHPCGAHGLLHEATPEVGSRISVRVLATDPARNRFSLAAA